MRLGKKFLWLALIPIMGAVLLAGCGSTSTSSGKAPDAKQVLRWNDDVGDTDIKDMDPATQTTLYQEQMAEMVFPTLYNLHYDGNTITLVPWVASGPATISGTTMTVKLRTGFKWTDGTPIDAADFAYSINRSLDPCTGGAYGSFFFGWLQGVSTFSTGKCPASQANATNPTSGAGLIGTSIIVVDSQTLQFKMAGAFDYAPWSFVTTPGMAVPQAFINQWGLKNWTSHLADNGGFGGNLFNLTSWDQKGHMTLDRNPNAASYPDGSPVLREIQVTFFSNAETAYSSYKDGQADVNWGLPPADCSAEQGTAEFHQVPFLDIGYVAPDWSVKPFNNKLARQAFDLAVDKTAIVKAVDQCTAFATNHLIPQGNPGYNPQLTGPDGTQSLTGNPTVAKQDFDQYASTNCPGGQAANCPTITLTLSSTSQDAQNEGAALPSGLAVSARRESHRQARALRYAHRANLRSSIRPAGDVHDRLRERLPGCVGLDIVAVRHRRGAGRRQPQLRQRRAG